MSLVDFDRCDLCEQKYSDIEGKCVSYHHCGEDSAISDSNWISSYVLCDKSELETQNVAKSCSYERSATSTLNAFLCFCSVLV